MRERRVDLDGRELASPGRRRAVLVRSRRDQGLSHRPAAAGLQGRSWDRHRRHPHGRERTRDAVRPVLPRRVDVFPRRHQRRRQRAPAPRPVGPPPGARRGLPLGRRRARRVAVTGPSRRTGVLIALGAVLLALSYPPFHIPVLSFVAVTPAVLLVRELEAAADSRRALRLGFWYGLVSQGLVLYWLVVALWHFTPLSALGYLATIAIYGLWYALMFRFVVALRMRLPRIPLWVLFPVAWTTVEWVVGHQGDIRFPWLGLGTSLADAPLLVQWADLAGARGVTLWLAWCNVMLAEALLVRRAQGTGSGSIRWRPLVAVLGT